jgi:hypothetical protein
LEIDANALFLLPIVFSAVMSQVFTLLRRKLIFTQKFEHESLYQLYLQLLKLRGNQGVQ